MFQILRRPSLAPGREMFEKDVGGAIKENDERLDELGGWDRRRPTPDHGARWPDVPGPTEVGETAHPATEREDAIQDEDASFDEMGEAVEYVIASLSSVRPARANCTLARGRLGEFRERG